MGSYHGGKWFGLSDLLAICEGGVIKGGKKSGEDYIVISPNEVFGDIMVLASPRPCPPPIDPDDVNTLNSKNIKPTSFKND